MNGKINICIEQIKCAVKSHGLDTSYTVAYYSIYFFVLLVYNYTIFYAVNIKLGKMYIHKVLLHIVP